MSDDPPQNEQAEPPTAAASHGGEVRGDWVAVVLVVALAAIVVLQGVDPARANHDVAWTLYAGGELAAGAEYGVDVIELNPPAILWLTAPLAASASALGLPPIASYNLAVLFAILAACFAAARLLRPVIADSQVRTGLALGLTTIATLWPRYAFGQRDHLIFLGLLPWLVSTARGDDADPQPPVAARVATGLAAALALAIKPHYAAVCLAVLGVMALRGRRPRMVVRAENVTLVVAMAVYALAIMVLAPRYLDVVRDAIDLYPAFDGPTALLGLETLPLIFAIGAAVVRRPGGRVGDVVWSGIVASAVSWCVVVAQGKGYAYHHLPSTLFAAFSILCLAADAVASRDPASRRRILRVGSAALGLAVVSAGAFPATPYPEHRALARVVREHAGDEPVLFLATTVNPAFPVLSMTGNRSPLPWPSVWWIPGHYPAAALRGGPFPYRTPAAMSPRERDYTRRVVERLVGWDPRVVLIHDEPAPFPFRGGSFSVRRYFEQIPDFRAALSRYRAIGDVGGFTVFVRRRADGGPG